MSDLVVLSGHPRPGSRTLALASLLAEALAAQWATGAPTVVDVAELGAGLLTPGHQPTRAAVEAVRAAKLLIVATPTYKGSYTGVLKVLLDYLPADALAGVAAVAVVTAGAPAQAEAADANLRRLLGELGARPVDVSLTVVEADLPRAAGLVAEYARTVRL